MSAVRELFRSHQNNVAELKEAQKATSEDLVRFVKEGEIKPEQVSIGEVFDVLVGESLDAKGVNFDRRFSDFDEIREEMVSSMFPYTTGKLINPAVIEQYEVDTSNIRQLVREVESNRREEDIVGFTDAHKPRHVEEGEPYPEAQMGEKRAHIRNHKFGQGLGLTVEMVRFDQTGELMNTARDSGTGIADILEEFIAYRLADTAWTEIQESTSQAFVYGGTRYAMYADDHSSVDAQTNDNLVGSGNGAPSISQVQTMGQLLTAMKTEKGRPARVRPRIVFGHAQMADQFEQFFNRQEYDKDSAEKNKNIYQGRYQIVTSQFFPSTSNWFLGDPARQFRLQWVWEPKVTVLSQGDPKRDILVNYYVSMFCGVGATDYRWVAKNNG
jgi:hypothetical protein